VNCFRSGGFILKAEEDDTSMSIIGNSVADDSEWVLIASRYRITRETFDDFVEIHKDVTVFGNLIDDVISDAVRDTEGVYDVKKTSSETVSHFITKQKKLALILSRTFTEQ
jgi:hypothetical protein